MLVLEDLGDKVLEWFVKHSFRSMMNFFEQRMFRYRCQELLPLNPGLTIYPLPQVEHVDSLKNSVQEHDIVSDKELFRGPVR